MNKLKMKIKIPKQYRVVFLIILTLMSTVIFGQSNLNKGKLFIIDNVINKHIKANHIPGATVLVIKDGEIIYNKAFGYSDVEKEIILKSDDIFRIASQSKAITILPAMILWEKGRFLLDDPVSKYISDFAKPEVFIKYNSVDGSYTTEPAKRKITIRDLLRHTSRIAYPAIFSDPIMWKIYEKAKMPSGIGTTKSDLQKTMSILAKQPLQNHPGESFTYGLNIDLLGYLIEIWSGQSLDVFLKERIFEPLETLDTYLHVPNSKRNRVVSLYEYLADKNKLVNVDHPIYEGVDANFPLMKGTYLSGAELSSSIDDIAKFYSLYLNKGYYKNKEIISPKTVKLMLLNQLKEGVKISPMPRQHDNFEFSLGGFAITSSNNNFLSPLSLGSFGWGGAFNPHGWGDPQEKMIALLFTQEYLSQHFSTGEEFQIALYQAFR